MVTPRIEEIRVGISKMDSQVLRLLNDYTIPVKLE